MSTQAIEFAPRSKPFLRQSGACMEGGEPVALGQTDRDKDDGDEAIKRMSTQAIEFAPRSKPFLRQSGACMVPPETVS